MESVLIVGVAPKMSDYTSVFEIRGDLYNQATQLCPTARETERRLLIERLQPRPGEMVIDAPAGGGYLAEGLADWGARVVCIEPSRHFAGGISDRFPTRVCPLTAIDLPDSNADKLGSLAGLHHLDDVAGFFSEAQRVLKRGGGVAVADVRVGTAVASFLNGFVDRWTDTGHEGRFFHDGELARLLGDAGFEGAEERFESFSWSFPDRQSMARYCHRLFGLTGTTAAHVEGELARAFHTWSDERGTHLLWSLIYASAYKP